LALYSKVCAGANRRLVVVVVGVERMKTWKRICLVDTAIEDQVGNRQELKCGQKYLTSEIKDGQVTVFSTFWCDFPVEYFAGEVPFTI
jgi:hypothetical protein